MKVMVIWLQLFEIFTCSVCLLFFQLCKHDDHFDFVLDDHLQEMRNCVHEGSLRRDELWHARHWDPVDDSTGVDVTDSVNRGLQFDPVAVVRKDVVVPEIKKLKEEQTKIATFEVLLGYDYSSCLPIL